MVSSRGVEKEVKSSKDMYPSLKPHTPDQSKDQSMKRDNLFTDEAAVTIQRFFFSFFLLMINNCTIIVYSSKEYI